MGVLNELNSGRFSFHLVIVRTYKFEQKKALNKDRNFFQRRSIAYMPHKTGNSFGSGQRVNLYVYSKFGNAQTKKNLRHCNGAGCIESIPIVAERTQ